MTDMRSSICIGLNVLRAVITTGTIIPAELFRTAFLSLSSKGISGMMPLSLDRQEILSILLYSPPLFIYPSEFFCKSFVQGMIMNCTCLFRCY